MYTIIRKRQVFHSLANLPSDYGTISKSLTKRSRKHLPSTNESENDPESPSMEGSKPALPAEPGTLKVREGEYATAPAYLDFKSYNFCPVLNSEESSWFSLL